MWALCSTQSLSPRAGNRCHDETRPHSTFTSTPALLAPHSVAPAPPPSFLRRQEPTRTAKLHPTHLPASEPAANLVALNPKPPPTGGAAA